MNFPSELVNHILSFRPTHPVALLIKTQYKQELKQMEEEHMLEYLTNDTFFSMTCVGSELTFKNTYYNTYFEANIIEYCDFVIQDYNCIMIDYGCV